MLTVLGASSRPVAVTAAPPACASAGSISGVGLASANTIGFAAMLSTIALETISPAPRNR